MEPNWGCVESCAPIRQLIESQLDNFPQNFLLVYPRSLVHRKRAGEFLDGANACGVVLASESRLAIT